MVLFLGALISLLFPFPLTTYAAREFAPQKQLHSHTFIPPFSCNVKPLNLFFFSFNEVQLVYSY